MTRALSAPGKLFLSGEYAVLWGGTARIAAVGPRTHALARQAADRRVSIAVEDGRLSGDATPLGVRWPAEVPDAFLFASRTLDLAYRALGTEGVGLELALASMERAPDGRKLGLGGSAWAAVATAEGARYVLEGRYDTLKLALAAHALAQGGKGSGGDVAAIFAGGVVRYRRYRVDELLKASREGNLGGVLEQSPPVDLWRLPEVKLPLAYVFAGESASTRGLIAQVEARMSSAERERFVGRSDGAGQQLELGLLKGDFSAVAEAAAELQSNLAGLSETLETETMRQALALAKSHGCAGKMSGAGGGDGCVVFCPDEDHRAAVLGAFKARGFLGLPLTIEPGLRGEAAPLPKLSEWMRT
ncbi:MAG: phosphomevalonate kinase [Myxococcaceae bacterium]